MKIFNRFILLIITLLFMFAVLTLAIYCFGFAGINSVPVMVRNLYADWQFGILFLVAFVAGAWVIYPFFSRQEETSSTIINQTELGEVDITLEALENLVQGLVMQQEGIEEINSELQTNESGIIIYLKGKVKPNTVIPDLTDDLQKIVKSYIEDTTGVKVSEVKVLIENIYEEQKTRVE